MEKLKSPPLQLESTSNNRSSVTKPDSISGFNLGEADFPVLNGGSSSTGAIEANYTSSCDGAEKSIHVSIESNASESTKEAGNSVGSQQISTAETSKGWRSFYQSLNHQ